MNKAIITLGNSAGVLGIILCGISVIARFMGYYHFLGHESMTLFNVGIGLMVFCMLIKQEFILWSLKHPG